MSSSGQFGGIAKRLLLISNILNTVKIIKLNVPEVISEENNDALLYCEYSGAEESALRWFFNGTQVAEWSPKSDPLMSGFLGDRFELSYQESNIQPIHHKIALRITKLSPELSGDYTCMVQSRGQEVRQTKSMVVYSPERDLTLEFNTSLIKCTVSRIYPQPGLIIEMNKLPIAQQQRIWRNGMYFDAECSASTPHDIKDTTEIACRLQIPQVAYTAITKKFITNGKDTNAAYRNRHMINVIIIGNVFISLFLFTTL